MIISLYGTKAKCNRWLHFSTVQTFLKTGLLYHQHCRQLNIPKRSLVSLMKFTTLVNTNTIARSADRPSKKKSELDLQPERRLVPTPFPVADVRFDT